MSNKYNHESKCHCHEHGHEHNLEHGHEHSHESNRKQILKIVFSIVVLCIGLILPKYMTISNNILLIIFLISYLIIAYSFIIEMLEAIREKDFLNENLLMLIASLGAFLLDEYVESIAVLIFFTIGEMLEGLATTKSNNSISELMDIKPDFARVVDNNETITKLPNEVKLGEIIEIRPGERVPIDGKIIKGNSYLNEKQLTGESKPRHVKVGDIINSGVINTSGVILVQTTLVYENSTISRILELVNYTESNKAPREKFITRFSKIYTPIVVILALLVIIIPSLITGEFNTWAYRGLTFLVVSCPCALVISIPLGFFAGIGAASNNGILIKGSNYLEELASINAIAFDKTGTLTTGEFKVKKIVSTSKLDKDKILEIAAKCESYSNHPIAQSIINANKKTFNKNLIKNIKEYSGMGISATFARGKYYVGNKKLIKSLNINIGNIKENDTVVYVASSKELLGYIVIGDSIKPNTLNSLYSLRKQGISDILMLTGDNECSAKVVASKLQIDQVYSGLLPNDKAEIVYDFKRNNPNKKIAFVGDGMNDAPVLAVSDLSISMGQNGSDAAIETSNIVLMDDKISHLSTAINISKSALRIIKQNIIFSISVKVLILILAFWGIANMWLAVFGDVGVMILAVLNSMRILHK